MSPFLALTLYWRVMARAFFNPLVIPKTTAAKPANEDDK
jgi:hypothetical protein